MSLRQKDDYFNILLKKFLPKFLKSINIDFGIAGAVTITNAKISGKKTKANPLNMTKVDQESNIKIINDLVKGVNLDMSKKINYLVNKNKTERGSLDDLSKSLKGLFDKDSPNYFNYKNRFKTIAFNESNRILNNSSFNNAKSLKATGKYLGQGRANPWPDSLIALGKYGSEDKAIPMDEPFTITYKGKQQIYMFPPGRVNDSEIAFFKYD